MATLKVMEFSISFRALGCKAGCGNAALGRLHRNELNKGRTGTSTLGLPGIRARDFVALNLFQGPGVNPRGGSTLDAEPSSA
jgi:hypothetical protein